MIALAATILHISPGYVHDHFSTYNGSTDALLPSLRTDLPYRSRLTYTLVQPLEYFSAHPLELTSVFAQHSIYVSLPTFTPCGLLQLALIFLFDAIKVTVWWG